MDREVVEQKLESLRRCLQRVETKCPADADTLAADFDLQDIVSLTSLISASTPLLAEFGSLTAELSSRYLGHPARPVIPCGGSGTLLWKRST
jgi:hypothetical protein